MVVALLAEKADIQYYQGETDPDRLVAEVQALGFGASLIPDHEGYQDGKLDIIVRANAYISLEVEKEKKRRNIEMMIAFCNSIILILLL